MIRFEFLVARRPDAHAQAVVSDDLELLGILLGLTRHLRVHAARVVADHSAEGIAIVRRRIRSEREVPFLGPIAKVVVHATGLHPRASCRPSRSR